MKRLKPRSKKKTVPPSRTSGSNRKKAVRRQRLAREKRLNRGAPTTYDPQFAEDARELAKLGATDLEIANFLGVTIMTLWNWQSRHQEFFYALDRGKEEADERVKRAVYARATGYTYQATKIFCTKDGDIIEVPYLEHVPPSDKAASFWLTNRQGDKWKERAFQEFDPDQPLKIEVEGGLPRKMLPAPKKTKNASSDSD